MKKSVGTNKRKWVENLAHTANKAKETNDSRALYKITRILAGKFFSKTVLSKVQMEIYLLLQRTN
jgi:hypothetical protein